MMAAILSLCMLIGLFAPIQAKTDSSGYEEWEAGPNLLRDGHFENGLGGVWRTAVPGSSGEAPRVEPVTGPNGSTVNALAVGPSYGRVFLQQQAWSNWNIAEMKPSTTYRLSAWGKGNPGEDALVELIYFITSAQSYAQPFAFGEEWQYIEIVFQTPADLVGDGNHAIRIDNERGWNINNERPLNDVLHITDVKLVELTPPSTINPTPTPTATPTAVPTAVPTETPTPAPANNLLPNGDFSQGIAGWSVWGEGIAEIVQDAQYGNVLLIPAASPYMQLVNARHFAEVDLTPGFEYRLTVTYFAASAFFSGNPRINVSANWNSNYEAARIIMSGHGEWLTASTTFTMIDYAEFWMIWIGVDSDPIDFKIAEVCIEEISRPAPSPTPIHTPTPTPLPIITDPNDFEGWTVGPNMLNGGNLPGGGSWQNVANAASLSTAESEYFGAPAIRVATGSSVFIQQQGWQNGNLVLQPNRTYRLSIWTKFENTDTEIPLYLKETYYVENVAPKFFNEKLIIPTAEWSKTEFYFTMPPGADPLNNAADWAVIIQSSSGGGATQITDAVFYLADAQLVMLTPPGGYQDAPDGFKTIGNDLIFNGGFENGSADWSFYGGASVQNAVSYNGAAALKIGPANSDAGGGQSGTQNPNFSALIPGFTYRLSAWGMIEAGAANGDFIHVSLSYRPDGASSDAHVVLRFDHLHRNWTYLKQDFEIPEGASNIRISIWTPALSVPLYIDDISLMRLVPEDYVEDITATVTINTAETHQTIEGFGFAYGKDAWWHNGNPDYFWDEQWLEDAFFDMGATMWRNILYPNNPVDSNRFVGANVDANWAKIRPTVEGIVRKANDLNIDLKIILTVFSPPGEYKIPQHTNGGIINPAYYTEYAEWLISGIDMYKSVGANVYGLSLQNEPNVVQFYNSTAFTRQQYIEMIKAVVPIVKAAHPEVLIHGADGILGWETGGNPGNRFHEEIVADKEALDLIDVWATHSYSDGVAPSGLTSLKNQWAAEKERNHSTGEPKPYWMTETSGYINSWTIPGTQYNHRPALEYAAAIQSALAYADISGWVWLNYGMTSGNTEQGILQGPGTLDGTNKGNMYYVTKQFYRYIRPGAVRVGLDVVDNETGATPADLLATAFVHDEMDNTVLIFVNTNATKEYEIILSGAPSGEYKYIITTGDDDVNCLHSATYTENDLIPIPAQSLVTLVRGRYIEEPVTVCENCGQEPCVCDEASVCENCGQEPCVCEEASVCENCGQEPCVCVSVVCYKNAKIISIAETYKNSRVWVLTFTVSAMFSNDTVSSKKFEVELAGNNANLDGKFIFGANHDLAGYTLQYDIKGNGSNIKEFVLK